MEKAYAQALKEVRKNGLEKKYKPKIQDQRSFINRQEYSDDNHRGYHEDDELYDVNVTGELKAEDLQPIPASPIDLSA
jgi:hypothetical protein